MLLGALGLKGCSAVSYFSTRKGSIIGAGRLSFRVRDGTGRFPAAMAAVTLFTLFWAPPPMVGEVCFGGGVVTSPLLVMSRVQLCGCVVASAFVVRQIFLTRFICYPTWWGVCKFSAG